MFHSIDFTTSEVGMIGEALRYYLTQDKLPGVPDKMQLVIRRSREKLLKYLVAIHEADIERISEVE